MKPTVVLVNGLAITRDASRMFDGVVDALQREGHDATRTLVRGDGSLEELADTVWAQLEPLRSPLVLLCHSMGGLQARTFLLDDRRAERIRAIATVGSPHAGTSLARVATLFGRAYRALTPKARATWNETHAAAERKSARRHGISLMSVVAATRTPRELNFRATIPLLERLEGPNDGLVSAASQRFGAHAFNTTLDHIECSAWHGTDEERALWIRLAGEATRALDDDRTGS